MGSLDVEEPVFYTGNSFFCSSEKQAMAVVQAESRTFERTEYVPGVDVRHQVWDRWPVNWSAVWVGTLAALAAILLFGLVAGAIGAQMLLPEQRIPDLKTIKLGTLAYTVCAAFFSFVIGGWVAGKISGILHSEPAMLHGAIVWLLTLPLLVAMVTFGVTGFSGGWYSGLATSPAWANRSDVSMNRAPMARSTQDESGASATQESENEMRTARNGALGAITVTLLGLVGSVLGGWMASGEPMTFTARHRLATR